VTFAITDVEVARRKSISAPGQVRVLAITEKSPAPKELHQGCASEYVETYAPRSLQRVLTIGLSLHLEVSLDMLALLFAASSSGSPELLWPDTQRYCRLPAASHDSLYHAGQS